MSGSDQGRALVASVVIDRAQGFRLDVSIRVDAGITAAVLGPNGAGKSTLVDAIAGLIPIDAGRIALGEQILCDPAAGRWLPPQQRGIGVVFQRYWLFDHLSVLDNVAFGPRSQGLTKGEARTRAGQWLETLGLSELADRRPNQLSGGQAQRAALARTLASEPDVLLLDEPMAALDVATRSALRRTLADHLATFTGPRLLITHDPTDAHLLADHLYILEAGVVTQSGSPGEILSRPATSYAAALAGRNLLTATADNGVLHLRDHSLTLIGADTKVRGEVLVSIAPNAVAIHRNQPSGSPRNAWPTVVAALEPMGDTVRVTLGGPVPLAVDITSAAADALRLASGASVWASVKATEIQVSAS